MAGKKHYSTSDSIATVTRAMADPRGLGLQLKEAAMMSDLNASKIYAKALILKRANVNVRQYA